MKWRREGWERFMGFGGVWSEARKVGRGGKRNKPPGERFFDPFCSEMVKKHALFVIPAKSRCGVWRTVWNNFSPRKTRKDTKNGAPIRGGRSPAPVRSWTAARVAMGFCFRRQGWLFGLRKIPSTG